MISFFMVFYFPFLFLLVLAIMVVVFPLKLNLKKIVFSIMVSSYFAILNAQKSPESDLLIYIEALNYISEFSFWNVFDFNYISIRSTEFVFNYYIWVISLIDRSGFAFTFFSVFLIYLFITVSLLKCLNEDGFDNYIIVILVLFLSITFSLSGHLIRQYMAVSFFFLGTVLLYRNKGVGIFCFLVSPFIHNAMLPLVLLYPIFYYLMYRRNAQLVSVFFLTIAVVFNQFINVLEPYMELGFSLNDGEIPYFLIMLDFMTAFVFFVLIKKKYVCNEQSRYVIPGFVILSCILIASNSVKLIFLRYYFMMDVFRAYFILSCIYVFYSKVNFNYFIRLLMILIFSVFSFLMFAYRMSSSPWDYGSDVSTLFLTTSFVDVYNRLAILW